MGVGSAIKNNFAEQSEAQLFFRLILFSEFCDLTNIVNITYSLYDLNQNC